MRPDGHRTDRTTSIARTGSIVGDETELKALHACGLAGAWLNATKSLTGHGLERGVRLK